MRQSRMTKPSRSSLCPYLILKGHQRRLEMARFGYLKASLFALACLPALAFTTNAQTPAPTPQVVMPSAAPAPRVAGDSSLYCAGFIRYQRLPHMPEIVGALDEQEQRTYADGDVVYLNAGSQDNIKEGQNFQIIRPR